MLVWEKEWNNLIRYVFFRDEELKKLMKVPSDTNIVKFTDKYFIRAGFTNELLEHEPVRIIYSTVSSGDSGTPNVRRNLLLFDIYVKKDILRTATADRLLLRTDLIADRIDTLLRQTRYAGRSGYRFWPAGALDLGTRTVGYVRHMISYYYMKVE